MFWDLRDRFLFHLYRGDVENSRLESFLPHVDTVRYQSTFSFSLSLSLFDVHIFVILCLLNSYGTLVIKLCVSERKLFT